MPPNKPQVAIVDDRIGWFMGGTYQFMTLAEADAAIAKLQSAAAELRGNLKREKRRIGRIGSGGSPSTGHAP